MAIIRFLGAGIGALLVIAGLAAALFFGGKLPLVGLDVGMAGAKLLVAAGIALALVMAIWGQAVGAFGGSMATLGLMAILVALAPEITVNVSSGSGADYDRPLGARLNELYEAASDERPQLVGSEPITDDVMTELGGLHVRRIRLEEAAQLRISVSDAVAYPEADPLVTVFQPGDNGHLDRVSMGTDDDGGEGLSSYLEVMLDAGVYFIEIKDIGHSADEGEALLNVEISAVTEAQVMEEFEARVLRTFPEEGVMVVGAPLIQWSGTTTLDDEQPLYRFSVDGSTASCLVVDVTPGVYGAPLGDSVLHLFTLDGSVDDRNDDWQEESFGSRLMIALDATEDGSAHEIFAEVTPFSGGTEMPFEARAAVLANEGSCPPLDSWQGERADY